MNYDRIVKRVVSTLLNPLRERRDYGGNQLNKGRICQCGRTECDGRCGRKTRN